MIIKSYIVQAVEGRGGDLTRRIGALGSCEIVHTNAEDVFILVTDTESEEAEDALQTQLEAISGLGFFSLVAAYEEPAGVSHEPS
jgi:nitrate reductase NapAB chaperone NapD